MIRMGLVIGVLIAIGYVFGHVLDICLRFTCH